MTIHPTALVEEGAQIGAGCVIHAHAIIGRHCVLESGVEVHPFAVIGGPAQDLSSDPSVISSVHIGSRTVIREHVTINRASKTGGATEIGADCYLMATAHVAHDCRLGNRVVMANAVLLGGHVHVADHTFIGGGAVVHQHCRIGEGVMISGGSRLSEDIAPYCLAAERNDIAGLNIVGLRRRGTTRNAIEDIKRAYHRLYRPIGNLRTVAESLLASGEFTSEEAKRFFEFFQGGTRRFARPRHKENSTDSD
jgi:UDP-N-acetylglucosamine acyltransferase